MYSVLVDAPLAQTAAAWAVATCALGAWALGHVGGVRRSEDSVQWGYCGDTVGINGRGANAGSDRLWKRLCGERGRFMRCMEVALYSGGNGRPFDSLQSASKQCIDPSHVAELDGLSGS